MDITSVFKYFVIGIALLLLGLGLGYFLTQRQPRTPSVTGIGPALPQFEFSPLAENLPATYGVMATGLKEQIIPVYRYESFSGTGKDRAIKWAQILGFAGEPKELTDVIQGNSYLWQVGSKNLVVDNLGFSLDYGVDLLTDPDALRGSFLPSKDQAAAVVERTISDLSPKAAYLSTSKVIQYLSVGGTEALPSNEQNADVVEVAFTGTIDNHPLYLPNSGKDVIVGWVGRDARLLRLQYYLAGDYGESLGNYPLKSQKDIEDALNRGDGRVVESDIPAGETVKNITVTGAEIAYLLPYPDASVLQPIYCLRGFSQTNKGTKVSLVMYLSAVKQ